MTGRVPGAAIAAALLCVALSGAACATPPPEPPPVEAPHGYVEGAEETAEAQNRLVVADSATGAVRVLDLATEEVVELGPVPGVTAVDGDGRHAYLTTADGAVHVVDSGAWTVDHGDHVHHYRAQVRAVGTVPSEGAVADRPRSDRVVAAVPRADGSVQLLDRARLDEGAVAPLATITRTPHRGPVVPYAEHLLVSEAEPGQERGSAVAVHGRDGARIATVDVGCPQLEGAAVTRRGAVFGCADGALLVTESDEAFRGEKIPYPRPVPEAERARDLRHRPGSATLVAPAGQAGVWVLDLAARSWNLLPTGPVIAANTAGAGSVVLTLTADGVLHGYDPTSGAERASTPLLTAPVTGAPAIEVDTSRAYVNDPAAGVVYEIDYADALRLARTFRVDGATHVVETGR